MKPQFRWFRQNGSNAFMLAVLSLRSITITECLPFEALEASLLEWLAALVKGSWYA